MSNEILIGLVIAFFTAIAAVVGNTWLASRNKRNEERVRFLTEAYMDLEFGHPRDHENPEYAPYSFEELMEMDRRFNKAIVAINLMGTPDQIELCRAALGSKKWRFYQAYIVPARQTSK